MLLAASITPADRVDDVVIPTVYEAGHFYATPTLANGKKLRLLLDTGGGSLPSNWINAAQAQSAGVVADSECSQGQHTYKIARPKFQGEGLPDLGGPCVGIIVVEGEDKIFSGQLVPNYFQRAVWTFDYPGKQVVVHRGKWKHPRDAHSAPLGFREDDGRWGWPRVVVTVDGSTLDMLLDTGATARLTQEGKDATHADVARDGLGVASYITASTFDRWKNEHPDWTVVDKGDELFGNGKDMAIIRVPEVEIAGWKVGPVWFTRRADSNFHEMMAQMMDKKPEGAVGANILDAFKLTVDYPKETAIFDCVTGCRK